MKYKKQLQNNINPVNSFQNFKLNQVHTLMKNPKINLSVFGHIITKSKNKKIIINKKKNKNLKKI